MDPGDEREGVSPAFSVGHGTAAPAELIDRLAAAGVRAVVDIRTAPGSRRHPQLGRKELSRWLPEAGIGYRWEPRLGGFRRPPADSPDVVWRNPSFRGYAAHLRTPAAFDALAELRRQIAAGPTAFMCSETVWWRCHRRLVADALSLLNGVPVFHLMGSRRAVHRVTPGARRTGDVLIYDGPGPASTTQV